MNADISLTLSFDEASGVLSIGWSARPAVNLGSSLGFKLSATEARDLASDLLAYAGSLKP
jgi:hypothetical protein